MASPTTFFKSWPVGRGVGCSLWGDILESQHHTIFPLTVLVWYEKFSFVPGYFEIKFTSLLLLCLALRSSNRILCSLQDRIEGAAAHDDPTKASSPEKFICPDMEPFSVPSPTLGEKPEEEVPGCGTGLRCPCSTM